MKVTIQKIHYDLLEGHGFLKSVLAFGSFFYEIIIKSKNFLYEKNILKEKSVEAYTICVGNITTGGVGKTPVVCEIANHLAKNTKNKIGILTRGYGGKLNNKNVNVIRDFNGILVKDAGLSGDEAFMISQKVQNCVVLTCRDRVKSANYAIKNFGCNILILDDGFSNRKIKKDLTILLADSKRKFGNNHLLPLGPNREPLSEIKRADKILVINKGDKDFEIDFAKKYNKPIEVANFIPDYFYDLKTSQIITPQKDGAIAFCAIGQPEQFYDYLKDYFDVKGSVDFEDHYKYEKEDIEFLEKTAKEQNVKTLITTQKDATKLSKLIENSNLNYFVLKLKPEADVETLLR